MRDLMMETAARGTVVGNLADLAVGSVGVMQQPLMRVCRCTVINNHNDW